MPRIKQYRHNYKANDISSYILVKMRKNKVSQQELGELLHLSRQQTGYKIRNAKLTILELLIVFEKLHLTKEEIGELLSYD